MMQKIMISLWKPDDTSAEDWRETLIHAGSMLLSYGAEKVRIMVVDAAVEKASVQRMTASLEPLDGMLSLWVDIEAMLPAIQACITPHAKQLHIYHVQENIPCPDIRSARQSTSRLDPSATDRTQGMCQLALFKCPALMDMAQWKHYWLSCHGFNAYALQSIFDCRQNLIIESLSPDAPEIHAIVEEHYPESAIGNPDAFYDAHGDAELLHQRQQALSDSVCSFMDFSSLDCILTSFYQVSAPN